MITYNKDVLNRTKTLIEKSSDMLSKINSEIFVEALFTELYGGNYASTKEIQNLNNNYFTFVKNIRVIYDYFNHNSKKLETKLGDKYNLILKDMIDLAINNYKYDTELENKIDSIYLEIENAIVYKGGTYNLAINRETKLVVKDEIKYLISLPIFETNNIVVPVLFYLPDIMECNRKTLTSTNYLDGIYNSNITDISKYPGIVVTPLNLQGVSMETNGGNLSEKGYENYALFINKIINDKYTNKENQTYEIDKNNINLVGFGQGTRKQSELIYRYISTKKNKVNKVLDNIEFNSIILATQGKNILDKILDEKFNDKKYESIKNKFYFITAEDDNLDKKANDLLDYTILNKKLVDKGLINKKVSKDFMDKVHPNYLPTKPINGRIIYLGKKNNLDGHTSSREYIFDLVNYINTNCHTKQEIYLDHKKVKIDKKEEIVEEKKELNSDKQIDLLNDSFEDNVNRLKNIPNPINYSSKDYMEDEKEIKEKENFNKNNILVETRLGNINLKEDFDEKINYSNKNDEIIDNTIIMKKITTEDIEKYEKEKEDTKDELEDTNYDITPIMHDGVAVVTELIKKNKSEEKESDIVTNILPDSLTLKPVNNYKGKVIEASEIVLKKKEIKEEINLPVENDLPKVELNLPEENFIPEAKEEINVKENNLDLPVKTELPKEDKKEIKTEIKVEKKPEIKEEKKENKSEVKKEKIETKKIEVKDNKKIEKKSKLNEKIDLTDLPVEENKKVNLEDVTLSDIFGTKEFKEQLVPDNLIDDVLKEDKLEKDEYHIEIQEDLNNNSNHLSTLQRKMIVGTIILLVLASIIILISTL